MVSDRLLSELDRQQKYLRRLPADFNFPLFNARYALESARNSGYRNTAAASREIVDNAIEAGADQIHIIFDVGTVAGRKVVDAIAFIDNGSGMLPTMARYALSWGGGTHFDDPKFIGRFGFGLPNASINQTRRVEVYTRTALSQSFTKVWLDLNDFADFGTQSIPEPSEAELPSFVQRYLDRKDIDLLHGTIVIWTRPDRLTYKKPQRLKEHLVDDFGVTYRYLLIPKDTLTLIIEGTVVQPVDPLFLLPEGRYYLSPEQGGAELIEEYTLSVNYYRDSDTGEAHLTWLRNMEDLQQIDRRNPNTGIVGTLNIRIARIPFNFLSANHRFRELPTEAHYRFDIRKPRRGMSFVRTGREVQTLDVFPKTTRDEGEGLGRWPLLQSYAYYWGVEVRFLPEFDEVFGITNDKQGVRPIEDFWRVLHAAGIDESLRRENRLAREHQEEMSVVEPTKGPSPAEQAAYDADVVWGRQLHVPEHLLGDAKEALDTEVERRYKSTLGSIEELQETIEKDVLNRPYRIDYFSSEDGPFFKPEWVGAQVAIWINQKHPFYQILYGDLLRLRGSRRAKEAVDLVLIALGKAELTSRDEQTKTWYEIQRKEHWSPFLTYAMKSLQQRVQYLEDLLDEGQTVRGDG